MLSAVVYHEFARLHVWHESCIIEHRQTFEPNTFHCFHEVLRLQDVVHENQLGFSAESPEWHVEMAIVESTNVLYVVISGFRLWPD